VDLRTLLRRGDGRAAAPFQAETVKVDALEAPKPAGAARMGFRAAAVTLVREAVSDWIDDRAMSRGAAIAYYTVFSLAPLLLLVIAIAGLVWGEEAARGAIMGQLSGLTGPRGAEALEAMIRSAGASTGSGILATVVGIGLLIFGATTVFAELQDSLNQMWNAPPSRGASWWSWLRVRMLSLSLIGAIAFLLLVSLVVSALMTAIGDRLTGGALNVGFLIEGLNFLVGFVITAALFAAIYKILPDVRISWGDVGIGGLITAALFHLGKYAIALYIGLSDLASSYGAASALVIILIWVYYSAQIFLLGAEFTKVYAFTFGSRRHSREGRPRGTAPNPEAREAVEELKEEAAH